MKLIKALCVIIALCFMITFIPTPILSDAGNIETNVKVNDKSWFDAGDVKIADDKIIFGDSANATTRIISNKKVSNMKSSGKEKWLDAEFSVQLSRLEDGKTFGFAFGLNTPSSKIPSAESNLIAFKADGNKVSLLLTSFDSNNEETEIYKKDGYVDAVNNAVKVKLYVNVDGGVSLSLDGTEIFNKADANIDAEGFVGFGQTGKFSAKISELSVGAYENATPMNADFIETFDKGEYNAEVLYSQGKTGYVKPSYVICEDGKFMFKNAGTSKPSTYNVNVSATEIKSYNYNSTSYISTIYPYSNVDLSFDCQFYGENSACSSGFSIILGRDFANESTENLKTEAKDLAEGIKKDLWEIRFGKSDRSIVSNSVTGYIELLNCKSVVDSIILPENLNVFSDENYGKSFSVWLQMLDGNLSVYVKFDDTVNFTKIYEYQMKNTPQGNVQIRANGSTEKEIFSTLGNFSIDNLAVTNFDFDGKKKSVKYRSNIWNTDDFKYEDTWNDQDIIKGGAQ